MRQHPSHFGISLLLTVCTAMPALAQTRTAPRTSTTRTTAKPVEPTGPTAVIDTSAGRFTCKLFTQQAPLTTASFIALAQGTKPWTDASGTQQAKPFYDALQIFGMSDGVASGDRAAMNLGAAGPDTAPEKTGLDFDRAGRLAALMANGKQSSSGFAITDHPDLEWARRGIVFGQCDVASVELSAKLTHELLSTDNHPDHPVVLRSLRIVPSGQPLPPPADPIPGEAGLRVPPPSTPAIPAPEPTGPTATIQTSMGAMTCRLFDKETPIAAANFIGLATGAKPFKNPATHAEVRGKHFYDGLTFGRIIPDFMVQNADSPGDPNGGGSGFDFANEIVPGLSFDRPGRLAYANGGPNTNSSEFFITEHPVRRLDGNYTIFGQCDDASVKVVEAIARVPRNEKNHPLQPILIQHITITPK